MPSNLLQADVGFPQLNDQQSQDEKITQIVNYLYMLLEQLRYNFGNIDKDNFSDAGLAEMKDLITEPIYARIANDEGLITELSVTAQGLITQLYDETTGDITRLNATAQGLYADMHDESGLVSTIIATAAALQARLYDENTGDITQLAASTAGLYADMYNNDGLVSTIAATAAGLYADMHDPNGTVSTIAATANGITARLDSFGVTAFSTSSTYQVGDYVTYNNKVYRCISAVTTAGAWNASNWEETNDSTIEHQYSLLTATANGLHADMYDSGGAVSTLAATAAGLYSDMWDANGRVATIIATASALDAQLHDQTTGEITQLQATASGLMTEVWGATPGQTSRITQTANSITNKVWSSDISSEISTFAGGLALSVTNGSDSSTIKLMSGNTQLSSKSISFSGMVTFSDLSTSGSTAINGSNITTGTIMANRIKLYGWLGVYQTSTSSSPSGYLGYASGETIGGKTTTGIGMSSSGGGFIATSDGARMLSSSGEVFCDGTGAKLRGYSGSSYRTVSLEYSLGLVPLTSGTDLGASSYKWANIYTSGNIYLDANQHIYRNGTQIL